MVRIKGDGDIVTFNDIFRRFNSCCQQGVTDANFSLVGLTDKYQGFHLATENILTLCTLLWSQAYNFRTYTELGFLSNRDATTVECSDGTDF